MTCQTHVMNFVMGKIKKPSTRFKLMTENTKILQKYLVYPLIANSLGKNIQTVLSVVCI